MNLRGAFTLRPWIAWPATALVACVVANIALFVHRGALDREYGRQRERERDMTRIAEDFRRFKEDMAQRSTAVAQAGALDVKRIEELAVAHRVAGDLNVTIPPARTDGGLTERFVDLSLANAQSGNLARFLLAVEALDPAVRTRSLRIVEGRESSGGKEKTFVDAKVQFSAYEKISPQPE